jgi:hypothetical protein
MFISDVSAIDRLLDFYGEYLVVKYKSEIFELGDLREHLVDSNTNMSINDHKVTETGIQDQNNFFVVKAVNLDQFNRDDLIKI